MRLKGALVALAAVAAAGVLWIGGELHRSNCYTSGNNGCSVLPWQAGEPAHTGPLTQKQLDRLFGGATGRAPVVVRGQTLREQFQQFVQDHP